MLPFELYLFITILSIKSTLVSSVQTFKLGVPLISSAGTPYDMERIGPAIDIAIERVNRDILNGSYQLVTIEKPYGKFCSGSTAPGMVADLVKDHAIIGLIGPACAYALDPTAKLANYWNIPIVTGFGDGGLFKNKTEYPTLTRLAYCQCRLRKVFGSIFIEFKWTNIAIIYDINDLHSRVLGTTLQTGLQKQQIFPKMFRYYGDQNTSYKDILLQVKKVSRVILLIVPGDSLREFMLDAFDLGFIQSGEYVFMDVLLFPFPGQYWGNHDWLRNDLRDQDAKLAYESLFRISLQVPTSVEWTNFTNYVKLLALSKYGFNFTNEEVNFFIGAFHDAVILFGMALNESLEAGSFTGNIDGYNFTRNMWDRIFNGITGQVIIDDNGDRDTSYSILDMDPVTGKFQVVANFFGDQQYYNPVPGKSVHWAGGRTAPPLNEPVCWYEGDNPECHITDNTETDLIFHPTSWDDRECSYGHQLYPSESVVKTTRCSLMYTIQNYEKVDMYALIFSSMGVLLVVAFSVLFYRHKKHEQDILNDSWRVKYDDLEFNYNNVTASCYSMVSEKSSKHHQTGTASKNVANYMGKVLYVREVKKQKISITRKVLIEIQQVRSFHHENLSRFVGACVEPSHILILYEYYRKGTLEDLLYNDTITLDWTFRLSLLKDIAKGMKYLHSSALKCHGSLRSSNCVVDGRFVVKISDFGLPSFSDDIVMESEKSRKMYHKLWIAPEHLRNPSIIGGSRKGDVYSFGIIMQEVITRSPPFDCCTEVIETDEIIARVASKEKPPYRPNFAADDCPASVHTLTAMCWTDDPDDRPEFPAILKLIRKQTGGKEDDLVDSLLRRMERYTLNLEEIVEERTGQLAAEKKRSDELLYQILPQSVANELRLGKFVTPEWFDSVTIYFSDIVGFTELSGSSSPMEVISLLNDLYSNFDSIIETMDVYKVETIGDAYMVVSGLPIRNGSDHAAAICRLSLELRQQIQNFEIRHRPGQKLKLRIGIHTGPCVAGVVGLKMPRYCLFGDTVNVASRMESNGEACKIHISSNTKEILDGSFDVEERGQLNIKLFRCAGYIVGKRSNEHLLVAIGKEYNDKVIIN